MNVHLKVSYNLQKFSGIVEIQNLDIVVVAETWFAVNTSNKIMGKLFSEDKYRWFSKERLDQKSSIGSGGVGILLRKSIGDISLVKIYDSFDGLWVKCQCNEDVLFVCGLYIPPDNGPRGDQDFAKCLQAVEDDCVNFKMLGKVIVMGDFNARIGSNQSMIQFFGGTGVFGRNVMDVDGGGAGAARSRGIRLVNSMDAAGMVIMNGIDSGGGYTFERTITKSDTKEVEVQTSMIDYIILSDNILLPGCGTSNHNVPDAVSNPVNIIHSIPENSFYIPNSCTVWSDYPYRIGDHFLLSCKLAISKPMKVPLQDIGEKLDIIKWVRRDHGNADFWTPMQSELAISLAEWNSTVNDFFPDSADSLVSGFNTYVNSALSLSLKISRPSKRRKNMQAQWHPNIFRLTYEENLAFRQFNNDDIPLSEKLVLRLVWKKCRTRLKNAFRNLERQRMKEKAQFLESLRSHDPREFWKGLDDLDPTSSHGTSLPLLVKNNANQLVGGSAASQVWMESFSKLGLENTDFKDYDVDFYYQIKHSVNEFELASRKGSFALDYPISLEEVQAVVKKLRNGKAVGVDGLFNEIWKHGGDQATFYLWKLYQRIFDGEQFPIDWARGLIYPLFKGGPEDFKLDPNKYRGITLLSVVGKTYTAILNNRLSDYCEKHGILVDEQAGFRRNRSTVDHLFTLIEIIKARRPKQTYCACIDVAKAYDKVWRDGLWYKLWKAGIRGKMWRILRNIYRKVESSVLLGGNRTAWFLIEVGLRQGCILSPLLFVLFINDLRDVVDQLGKGVQLGNGRVSILFFADDIVLLAESKEDLEEMLQAVFAYSLKWRLKFNYDKCNVIRFDNQKGRVIKFGNCDRFCQCGHHYSFGANFIKEVLMYKYLGIELDNCLSFKFFKERTLVRARMNMGRIWSMGIKGGDLSVPCGVMLWQALVRSGLEYGCVVWGKEQWLEGEQVQADMAKKILRCSTMSTREALLGDLGWWSLQGRRNLKKLIYWFHLATLDNSNLVRRVYLVTKQQGKKSSWAHIIHGLLDKYGLSRLWDDYELLFNLDGKNNLEAKSMKDHKSFWKKYITSIILQHEEKDWRYRMVEKKERNNKSSKLRNYVVFKKKLCMEKYLIFSSNSTGRILHTSLRNGTNALEIERGRWKGIPKEYRYCTLCDLKQVEDEKHFVLHCPIYHDLRIKFYQAVSNISGGKWRFHDRPPDETFILIMQGTGDEHERIIFRILQCHLVRCFKLRNQLKERWEGVAGVRS